MVPEIEASADISLSKKLEEKRQELKISDRAFARLLGVSTTSWWNIKQGEREMGRRFLGRVMSEFPEFESDVLRYLREPGGTAAVSA